MTVFDVLTLICGLTLFLYGMDVMGDALKKSAGGKLKTILGNLTSSKWKGLLLGLGVTAIIQSSSATTVMVVGFVNSGTMLLSQAMGVIMGANVGAAVTTWLTALNGIGGSAADATEWLEWLKPGAWMPILALIGIILIMFAKKDKKKNVGYIFMGFAVLMVGMDLMSGSVGGLNESEEFQQLLLIFNNPFLGVLAGTLITAIVQSSAASVGILQALSSTGVISYSMAMPIIMGQNIGTCITAMLSSISANKNGKRAALMHLYYNIIGVIVWMAVYYLIGWILTGMGVFDLFAWAEGTIIDMWGIAAVHTVFKLFSMIVFMPVSGIFEKLATATVRTDTKGDSFTDMLDERLLGTPSVAIERCHTVASQMAKLASGAIQQAITLLINYDEKVAAAVHEAENKVDVYEDVLGSYLMKLSASGLTENDSHEVTKLLYMIGDFERISDHAVNVVDSAEEIQDKGLEFSEKAISELNVMCGAIAEIMQLTEEAFINQDEEKAHIIEPLEQVVDDLKEKIRVHHIRRLQKEECTMEHGFVLSDILTDLERVSDHCSNVGTCLIELSEHEDLDIHEYKHHLKEGGEFDMLYHQYKDKYTLKKKEA